MADPNALPNNKKEELDAKIDKKINEVLSKIDWTKIDATVDERLKSVDKKLEALGLSEPIFYPVRIESMSILYPPIIKIKPYVI